MYLADNAVNAVFLPSGTPGDWALGEFIGRLAAETRARLGHLITGKPCNLATAASARSTLAIQQAAATGEMITLPLS